MQLVSNTKTLLQKLRNEDCDSLFEEVVSFCNKFEIDIPDFGACYVQGRGRHQRDHITVEYHYYFDIFRLYLRVERGWEPHCSYTIATVQFGIVATVYVRLTMHFSKKKKITTGSLTEPPSPFPKVPTPSPHVFRTKPKQKRKKKKAQDKD